MKNKVKANIKTEDLIEKLSKEDIEAVLKQREEARWPERVYPAQLEGFGPENWLVTDDPKMEWYRVMAHLLNAQGFSGQNYMANALNTWPILAKEVLELREQLADMDHALNDPRGRPAWRIGPGADRPANYMQLSPREQVEIDKRLGILDAVWCPRCASTNVKTNPEECKDCGWKPER